ncbi:MAG: hypothetical protein AAF989_11100 [Planctomycetota bacterium]
MTTVFHSTNLTVEGYGNQIDVSESGWFSRNREPKRLPPIRPVLPFSLFL